MKATKKIVGAACALVAAVALSAGSTFAWFTANSDVSVGTVTANVVTLGGDLQVAIYDYAKADGATEYTKGDLGTYGYNVDAPFNNDLILTAVTSKNGQKMLKRDQAADATDNLPLANTTSDAGGYIEFTISLRSTTAMHVYLGTGTTLTSTAAPAPNQTTIKAWDDIAANTYGTHGALSAGADITAAAKDAARVSFATNDSTPVVGVWAPNEIETYGGLTGATGAGYCGNATSEKNLASDYEQSNDDTKTAYENVKASEYTSAGAKCIGPAAVAAEGSDVTYAATNLVVDLEAGEAKEVTIRLWLEGRDGDCFNSIFTQSISLTIALHGVDIDPDEAGNS